MNKKKKHDESRRRLMTHSETHEIKQTRIVLCSSGLNKLTWSLFDTLTEKLENDLIPNTERIADEGEEDMKEMYVDRLQRAWDKMGYDK